MKKGKTEFAFENISDQDMIDCFNQQIYVQAYVSAGARYFAEWKDEVIRRKWHYDDTFLSLSGLSLKNEILLEDKRIKQIGEVQNGKGLLFVQQELNQEELFILCVQKGLLKGYFMESTPMNSDFFVRGNFENAELKRYLKELIYANEFSFFCSGCGSDNLDVEYQYSEKDGLTSAGYRNAWPRDGWANRIDHDLPDMCASAQSFMESYAYYKGIIGEYDALPLNEQWTLRLNIREGSPSAFLVRDGNLLQMGTKDDPFSGEVFNSVLPSFSDVVYTLNLELIYQEGKMDWDDMDIMTQDLAAGYVPNEEEMTPFKASDVY